jgi:threonine/homoserine/homoserine lactone efflux protein
VGQAIGGMLPAAVGVAISPLPIVAVVLMLVSSRGRVNGLAFVLGWVAGIVAAGAILLVIGSSVDLSTGGESADRSSWLKVGLGVLLLFVALRQFRGRPHDDEEPATPHWMGALDTFTPAKAAGAGVVLSALNPKNLLLIVAGMTAIAETGISTGDQIVALVVFALVASLGVGAPVAISIALGDRSRDLLDRLKTWMEHNNAVIISVLLLLIGVKLIGDAIAGLSG